MSNSKKIMVTHVESMDQFSLLRDHALDYKNTELEVIVGCLELSRYTNTKKEDLLKLIHHISKEQISVVLEWDGLYQEDKFIQAAAVVDSLPLHEISAIRVQDPGAVEYIKNKYPWLKIQLVLENGNHNLAGLMKWSEYLGEQCSRLILSNELSKEKLKEYASVLKAPLEILLFGRILLFYSPRLLLSPLEKDKLKKSWITASGSSEESPHSGFPLIENRHGTFMFNVKDLSLLDHLEEISQLGIAHTRVDLRFDESFNRYIKDLFELFSGKKTEADFQLKINHPRPVIKGFYNVNKTDVLFTKLKNSRTQRQDDFYLGEIVDVERNQQLALLIKTNALSENLEIVQEIKMVTPEGKIKIMILPWIKSTLGLPLLQASKNDLVLIPYTNGVTVKTQVYINKSVK